MISSKLNQTQFRDMLLKNWMTHDALWYGEVAAKFGMAVASPMNLKVCRKLGQIEFKRLMKSVDASPPKDMGQYITLFELAKEVFFPDFMTVEINYPNHDTQRFHVLDCFAHKGMQKAGLLPEYQCGIFERIAGWFEAMGLKYDLVPNLDRCLKFRGQKCKITVMFDFM